MLIYILLEWGTIAGALVNHSIISLHQGKNSHFSLAGNTRFESKYRRLTRLKISRRPDILKLIFENCYGILLSPDYQEGPLFPLVVSRLINLKTSNLSRHYATF